MCWMIGDHAEGADREQASHRFHDGERHRPWYQEPAGDTIAMER